MTVPAPAGAGCSTIATVPSVRGPTNILRAFLAVSLSASGCESVYDSIMAMFRRFRSLLHRLYLETTGQDLIEYALVAGFVAVAAGAIFPAGLMPNVSTIFSKINSCFTGANSFGS